MRSIVTWITILSILISNVYCDEDKIGVRLVDDIISVELPDKVTYTLIVVMISYVVKMIFDIIYRLRKMECRWGSLCFCKSQFKDDEEELKVIEPTCPACSPNVHVNINNDSSMGLTERRARLNSIIVDS